MKISELKVGQGKVDMDLEIKSIGPLRSFNKNGRDLKVVNAEAVDSEGGKITLSLWNDDAEKFKSGDFVTITNGYVSEFNGQKQLGTGKFGKIEISGKSGSSGSVKSAKEEKPAKKKVEDEDEEYMEEVEF